MVITVLMKRTILLDGEEVSCDTLLKVLDNIVGYLDFDDVSELTYSDALALERMGVLKRYEDAMFYEWENYDKFMEFLRLPTAQEVLSL